MFSIDSPTFIHRKIVNSLNNNKQLSPYKNQQYSPKRRWDQNAFGKQRELLTQHVSNVLIQQQKNHQILQKFRKQTELWKQNKRKQKYGNKRKDSDYKYTNSKDKLNRINQYNFPIHNNNNSNIMNLQYPSASSSLQPQPAIQQTRFTKSVSQNSPFSLPSPYLYEYPNSSNSSLLQYQKLLTLKNKQLKEKSHTIKSQQKQIKKLYYKIQQYQKQSQLQKFIKENNQIKKLTDLVMEVKGKIQQNTSKVDEILLKQKRNNNKNVRNSQDNNSYIINNKNNTHNTHKTTNGHLKNKSEFHSISHSQQQQFSGQQQQQFTQQYKNPQLQSFALSESRNKNNPSIVYYSPGVYEKKYMNYNHTNTTNNNTHNNTNSSNHNNNETYKNRNSSTFIDSSKRNLLINNKNQIQEIKKYNQKIKRKNHVKIKIKMNYVFNLLIT